MFFMRREDVLCCSKWIVLLFGESFHPPLMGILPDLKYWCLSYNLWPITIHMNEIYKLWCMAILTMKYTCYGV